MKHWYAEIMKIAQSSLPTFLVSKFSKIEWIKSSYNIHCTPTPDELREGFNTTNYGCSTLLITHYIHFFVVYGKNFWESIL